MTRENAAKALDQHILRHEWALARQHYLFPGVGQPVAAVPHSKLKVDKEQLLMVLEAAREPDMMQLYLFGLKVYQLACGQLAELNAAGLSKKLFLLVEKYLRKTTTEMALNLDGISITSERCIHTNQKQIRCFLAKGHDGQHKCTSKLCMCEETLAKVVRSFTVGEVISMAGLADEDVVKGFKNFRSLRKIAQFDSQELDLTMMGPCPLFDQINRAETFHRTGFRKKASRPQDGP
jgi:hypothetical protein